MAAARGGLRQKNNVSDGDADTPRATSSDYKAMESYWKRVCAILGGVDAMRATGAGFWSGAAVPGPATPVGNLNQLGRNRRGRGGAAESPYLPQFPNELNEDYDYRRTNAPFTNVYADISQDLADRPFAKRCELDEEAGEDLKKIQVNIDGQGTALHLFAADVFKAGIDKGIDWMLIDFPTVRAPITLGEERERGLRPYWVHVPAERMLAVYSTFFGGQEVIVHARIYEPVTSRAGFSETCVERIRVFDRALTIDSVTGEIAAIADATWTVYELREDESKQQSWVPIADGPISIGIVPIVPFISGKRDGTSWRVDPPLKNIANLQIEEFQQESNLKSTKEVTAFPMLAGNGVAPQKDAKGTPVTVPVGPRAVLFAPPSPSGAVGSWDFIEPQATSLTFLKSDLEGIRREMREQGKQPLSEASLTVVTTANVSLRATSAVQAWALKLKDALEQGWKITCLWMSQSTFPTVNVHTDFAVDMQAGHELDALDKGRARKDISQRTYWDEMKRRGVLSDDFNADDEEERLAEETQGLEGEVEIDPLTGKPVEPAPQPGLNGGAPPPKPPQRTEGAAAAE